MVIVESEAVSDAADIVICLTQVIPGKINFLLKDILLEGDPGNALEKIRQLSPVVPEMIRYFSHFHIRVPIPLNIILYVIKQLLFLSV